MGSPNLRLATLVAALHALTLGTASAIAAPVTGSYQGTISFDSGLGLLGERLRIDFAYDDAVVAQSSGDDRYFEDFLQTLTVSIGAYQWAFAPGGESVAFVTDDAPSASGGGREDTFAFFTTGYTGPEPFGKATDYSLTLFMIDASPATTPDAIDSDARLPALAPSPLRFDAEFNSMIFSFRLGEADTGEFVVIETAGVAPVSAVSLPGAGWLALCAVGMLGRFTGTRRAPARATR